MCNNEPKEIDNFLINDLGLSQTSIELGIKLSIKNKTSLPVALWSHSLITTEELDKFYNFMWN
tara:strand:+ start:2660 stop:2848 length:189 start_codon:yes stop_codon:yes gene_type:complete